MSKGVMMPDIEPIDPNEGRGWKIDSLDEADFAARTMLHYTAKVERIREEYDTARDKAIAAAQHKADHKRFALNLWWIQRVEADKDEDPNKPQTLTLPCGVELQYRPNKVGDYALAVDDEEKLLAYAAEHDLLNKAPKPSPDKKRIKALLKDGKEVPGAHLEEPEWEPYRAAMPAALVKLEEETSEHDD